MRGKVMDESEQNRGPQQFRFLFAGVAAVITSLLLILIVLVVLAVATYQQGLKSDLRGTENAALLREIKSLQALNAQQNLRRAERSAHAAAATEKAVARVSAKADEFKKILKQTPAKQTVVVHPAPQPVVSSRPSPARRHPQGRRHAARHAVRSPPRDPKTGQPLRRWEGRWDEARQQWIGGWK